MDNIIIQIFWCGGGGVELGEEEVVMVRWRRWYLFKQSNDEGVDTPKAIAAPNPDFETDSMHDTEVEETSSDPSSSSFATSPQLLKNDQNEVIASTQVDLLGLDELIIESFELGDKNALALAVVTSEYPSNSAISSNLASESTSWELHDKNLHIAHTHFVTAPSSNEAAVADSKLGAGLDKLILESLYDDTLARARIRTSTNNDENYYHQMALQVDSPLEVVPYTRHQDTFYASNNIAPPTGMQMEAMPQHLHQHQHQQHPMMIGHDPTNPFGNPFLDQAAASSSPSQNPFSALIWVKMWEIMMGFHPLPKTLSRQRRGAIGSSWRRGEYCRSLIRKALGPPFYPSEIFLQAMLTHLLPMLDTVVHMNPHSSSFLLSHIHGDCTYESHRAFLLSHASS
ncbi:unnamed protein product [Camellia sinensis]